MSEIERSTSSQEQAIRQPILVVQNITLNAFLFLALGITLAIQTGSWQAYQFIILSTMVIISGFVSMVLIRRERLAVGAWVFFIADLIAPIWAALLVSDLGYVAVFYILVTSYFIIAFVIPQKTRPFAMTLAILGLVISIITEVIAPPWRLVSDLMLVAAPILTGLLAAIFIGVIAGQMWRSGRLRNKIIVMMIGALSPVLIISSYFSIQSQRQALEASLLERAEAVASSGAVTFGHLLEDAIESETLTYEQVFDREYIKFWEFDPANDPNFDPKTGGDPASYDKYHTAYDAYTDEHWQELVDSFLSGEDMLYSVAVDINGYLPTHNSRYATGDGTAANDRTKRIFNDPVSIQSARNTEPILRQVYPRLGTSEILWDVSAPIYVNGEHWGGFRVGFQLAENQARIVASTWQAVISGVVVIAFVVGFAWFLGRFISEPLEKLTGAAVQAAEGDLNQQISIPNRDEITILADSFTNMITQLRDLVTSLEQRIAARTRALETSTQVSRQLSTILDQRDLVREVVEQVQSAFNYYHAHIYLFDDNKEKLLMVGGTGEAGRTMLERGHSVSKGRGLVGRAADTNLPVLVSDVSEAEGWLPNPLLPETRAEVAIPIAIGENVLGVLDVQDNHMGGLAQEDVNLLQSIANQVAVALQNAQAYQRTQQQVAREALLTNINQQILGTTDVEDALQVAVRELGRALGTETGVRLKQPGDGNGQE